ncbi:hypothetical protein Ciccas_003733 [Cichlidogyrus casuarinus]|uniref:ubiquitinyl hydrolase 1 n=1 Tax=Cichlidogyrus casuarinus TaxID=1844966 RepID=A0ABD2QDY6_9PLAT
MSAESSTNSKWICAFCTYENWPASLKCTICRNEPGSFESQASSSSSGGASQTDSDRWPCQNCTFLNCNKSRFCTQCRSAKPDSSSSTPSSEDPVVSLQFQAVGKWTCINCTYANWSKSKFCIMCKVAKNEEIPSSSSCRSSLFSADSLWLKACKAVLYGKTAPVDQYMRQHGDLDRKLTKQDSRCLQSMLLNSETKCRTSAEAIRPGLTLLDLALCSQHMNVFHLLLCKNQEKNQAGSHYRDEFADISWLATAHRPLRTKRTPCLASPIHAREIRRKLLSILHQHKSDFSCTYLNDFHTFALPSELHFLPSNVRALLLHDLSDQQVQQELEEEAKAINWWAVQGHKESSRLYAVWNRSSGDCLLDSVLQACWGVFDRDNHLRQALAESMRSCESYFYPRWRDYEIRQTSLSLPDYEPMDFQFERDWQALCHTASQPRESLEQFHVFVLAHLLRRPIIIYGVKLINNFRAEPIGIAHFQGIYLPLLWQKSFCSKTPIFLGYTKGHFSALVPQEPPAFLADEQQATGHVRGASPSRPSTSNEPTEITASNIPPPSAESQSSYVYLPLFDLCGQLLPIHFATQQEARNPRQLLHEWFDIVSTKLELPLCRMKLTPITGQVKLMTQEWLKQYRYILFYLIKV